MGLRIAVLDDYADIFRTTDAVATLAGHQVEVFCDPLRTERQLVERLQPFEVLLLTQQRTALPASILDALPRLRLISQTGTHSSHIDLDTCKRRGIEFRTSGRGRKEPTVELTWALILAATRHIPYETARLKGGHWQSTAGRRLADKTLGIYAYGNMGSRVAAVGAAFGMHVLCLGRGASLERAAAAGFATTNDRERFFAEADVLSLHLPLEEATAGIVTAGDLRRMKPDALLVNTSRAGLVEKGALHAALKAGRPGSAAIDVFEQEPVLDADDPLLQLEQVVATPHLGYCVREQLATFFDAAAEQIAAYARENTG